MMFYDFTEEYHVNVNNALELAKQSVHHIGLKHKPYIINVGKRYFYDRELDRARTSSFVNILVPLSPVKMSQEPSFLQPRVHYFPPYLTQKLTKSLLITNMGVSLAFTLYHMYILLSCLNC